MSTDNIDTKIDGASRRAKKLAAKTSAKIEEVAGDVTDVTNEAGDDAERAAKKGERWLGDRVEKAGQAMEEIAAKVVHSGRETAEWAIHEAKEVLIAAEHRLEGKTRKTAEGKPKSQPR